MVTIGHALAVAVRLRTTELATLRALGMTARGTLGIVAMHASTIVAVGTAIGVPIGIVAGSRIWTSIAERAHVVVLAVLPVSAIAALLLAIAVVTAALAIPPAWRAFRLRPAEAVRAH
jgi:putative ABC transport system permease protein